MSEMIVLGVTGGGGLFNGVREMDFEVGAYPVEFRDERIGPGTYRGRPYVRGYVVVEDAFSAVLLVAALPADITFTVAAVGGAVGTISIIGLRCDAYSARIGDGTATGPVTGYAVSFIGTLGQTITTATAAIHV